MTRHFLRDDDLTPGRAGAVLDLAAALKADPFGSPAAGRPALGGGALRQASPRTRLSFEAGIAQLGGHPIIVDAPAHHFGRGETIADAAPGAVPLRRRDRLADLRRRPARRAGRRRRACRWSTRSPTSSTPARCSPTCRPSASGSARLAGLTLAYLGDGANNMAHSLLLAGATAGLHVRVPRPAGFRPDPDVLAAAGDAAARPAARSSVLADPHEAADGADVLATDTWTSMGQEDDGRDRLAPVPAATRSTPSCSAAPPPGAIVLHCLPAHRGEEITDEVIDGPPSAVLDQAENRLHAQKALLDLAAGRTTSTTTAARAPGPPGTPGSSS